MLKFSKKKCKFLITSILPSVFKDQPFVITVKDGFSEMRPRYLYAFFFKIIFFGNHNI